MNYVHDNAVGALADGFDDGVATVNLKRGVGHRDFVATLACADVYEATGCWSTQWRLGM
jgi:hypothetical protein